MDFNMVNIKLPFKALSLNVLIKKQQIIVKWNKKLLMSFMKKKSILRHGFVFFPC